MGVRYNTTFPQRDNLVLLVDAENPKCYPGSGSVVKNLANTFDDGVSDAVNEFPGYTARSGSMPAVLSFDGETEANDGDHLAFPEELRNGRGNQITVVALLYPTITIGPEAVIFSPSPGASGDTGFRFLLSSFSGDGTNWGVRSSAAFDGTSEVVEAYFLEDGSTLTGGDLAENNWHFLAMNGESGVNDVKLFRNGNFVQPINSNGGTNYIFGTIDWGDTGQEWRIADGIGGQQRHGGFDLNFLGVWDTRLTDAELTQLWEQLRVRVGL